MKLTERAEPAPGPSSSDNNNIKYVIPGLGSLSGLLTRSYTQTSASIQGLGGNMDKDLTLYENKASLYNLHLSHQATVREDGVKELPAECPLRFWFGQVYFTLQNTDTWN